MWLFLRGRHQVCITWWCILALIGVVARSGACLMDGMHTRSLLKARWWPRPHRQRERRLWLCRSTRARPRPSPSSPHPSRHCLRLSRHRLLPPRPRVWEPRRLLRHPRRNSRPQLRFRLILRLPLPPLPRAISLLMQLSSHKVRIPTAKEETTVKAATLDDKMLHGVALSGLAKSLRSPESSVNLWIMTTP